MASSLSGTRIREQRRRFGITQTALAKRAGISTSYLNLIEHNKRRIGGALLLSIARELDIPITNLTEGADTELINTLHEVAAYLPEHRPETADLGAIAERFPGWSGILAALYRQTRDQESSIAALSDRLTHDPFLAESLHLMLSNITAIRSTAGILKSVDDIGVQQQNRFHNAIHDESKRLSDAAQALIAYFDKSEEKPAPAPDHIFSEQDAVDLPLDTFEPAAIAARFDPVALANTFGTSIHTVFRRLACLQSPDMGLIAVNAAGQALHRHALPDFPLPRHGNACPLWPVFRCLSQPNQPTRTIIELPSGGRFLTFSVALPGTTTTFDIAPDFQSAMLIIPLDQAETFGVKTGDIAPRPVGTSCRICPRTDCLGRAEPMILEESQDLR